MSSQDEPAARRGAVLLAAFAAGVMIAQQVAGKATRDALFLDHYGASELPKVMLTAAALSILGVLLTSSGMQRWGPGRLVPVIFAVSGALFAVEWVLLGMNPGLASWTIYLHMAVFGATLISGFWSVVNERFDPHSAKKAVARITAAATFGGLIGGLTAERVAVLMEPRAMLLILAVLNLVCAVTVWRVGAYSRAAMSDDPPEIEPGAGLRILREVPYLQKLGLLVLLVAMTTALLDFALKAQASERLESDHTLMQFFAIFYTATGLLTFIVQSLFAKRALSRFGLDGTIALLPVAVLLTGVLATAVTRMWTVVVVKGFETVLQNSLFRSGYELLYTPLSAQRKRPTKTIVDVAFDRVGDALGSGVVFLVLWVAADAAVSVSIGIAVAAAIAAFVVSRTLQKGYVDALAESLRTGAVKLEDADVVDATTRRTLSQTTMALDRERLLAEVAALRERDGESSAAPNIPERISRPSDRPPRPVSEDFTAEAEALASDDPARIRRALADPFDTRLTALAIPLLARRDLRREVETTLGRVAPRITGQLVDALLDQDQPSVVRRRVARVLGKCSSERAAAGLFEGLQDPRFEVRFQCAQALSRMVHDDESLAPDSEKVFDAAIRELEVGRRAWDTQKALAADPAEGRQIEDADEVDEEEHTSHWLDEVLRARLHRSLEHVFTILSLSLDRETLLLSVQALHADNEALRGTALEYLENILPDRVYRELLRYLDYGEEPKRPERRSRAQIADELLQSMDSLRFDRSAVLGGSKGDRKGQ